MKTIKNIILGAALLASFCACTPKTQWISLFNGENLDGWKQVGGTGSFTVVDGAIVGEANDSTASSFLINEGNYSDFILEFEFKFDEGANSGVQFRSAVNSEDRVAGYQFEFDGTERSWTGGIYDQDGRRWIYPMTYNVEAESAYLPGEWNKGRVEAIGNSIRTFVNGEEMASIWDDASAEGFVALQVHNLCALQKAGAKVAWRNINICTENVSAVATAQKHTIFQKNLIDNTLTAYQQEKGWKLLWDGKTTEGWRGAKLDEFPSFGWKIENGILKVLSSGGAEAANGGDIVTIQQYSNFVLSVDFKITDGANSGIKYFVQTDLNKGEGSAIGCEFQILDDLRHPDAKLGVEGNRTLGSLYDLIRAEKDKAYFRHNDFNNAVVKVDGNHVEHWLNGIKVVEYDRNNQMFNALVAYSKYKRWPDFGNFEKGHILLQDHGDEVWYKNVMIREL